MRNRLSLKRVYRMRELSAILNIKFSIVAGGNQPLSGEQDGASHILAGNIIAIHRAIHTYSPLLAPSVYTAAKNLASNLYKKIAEPHRIETARNVIAGVSLCHSIKIKFYARVGLGKASIAQRISHQSEKVHTNKGLYAIYHLSCNLSSLFKAKAPQTEERAGRGIKEPSAKVVHLFGDIKIIYEDGVQHWILPSVETTDERLLIIAGERVVYLCKPPLQQSFNIGSRIINRLINNIISRALREPCLLHILSPGRTGADKQQREAQGANMRSYGIRIPKTHVGTILDKQIY